MISAAAILPEGTSMTAPVASGWSDLAGWDSHPLESAAFARRTRRAAIADYDGLCRSWTDSRTTLLQDPRKSSRFRFDAEPLAIGFDDRSRQKSDVIQAEGWELIWRRCPLSGRRGLVSADAGGKVVRSINAQSFVDAFNHRDRITHQFRVRNMCDPARRMVERHHLRRAALHEANSVLHRGAVGPPHVLPRRKRRRDVARQRANRRARAERIAVREDKLRLRKHFGELPDVARVLRTFKSEMPCPAAVGCAR